MRRPTQTWAAKTLLLAAAVSTVSTAAAKLHAQVLHAQGPLPTFEVATIKPWKRPSALPSPGAVLPTRLPAKVDPSSGGPRPQASDRVHMIIPTRLLITFAYGLPMSAENRIVHGPDWMDDQEMQWEINGKIDDATFAAMQKLTPAQQHEQIALMEQALLAERFKLKVHFESKEAPAYALVAAKGGPKLTPAQEDEKTMITSSPKGQGVELTFKAATLEQFAHSPFITGGPSSGGRPVMNQTGLGGSYDFTLHYGSDTQSAESGPAEPTFFTALQEQLGLRMIPSKTQVESIVIDHIERPTPD